MNVLSDSESSDSDTGRRFKTESTRSKADIRVRRRSDEGRSRSKHGERSRHDNSRSSPARRRTRSPADHRDGHKRRHRSKSRSKSRETSRRRHTKERSRSRSRGKDKRNKDEKQSKHEPNSSPRKRQKSPRHKSNLSKKSDRDRSDSKKPLPKLSDKREKHVNHSKNKERLGKEEKTNEECQQHTKRSTSKEPLNPPLEIDNNEPTKKIEEENNRDENEANANLLCGPSLPPHMLNAESSQCTEPAKSRTPSPEPKKVYGPSMPSDFLPNRPSTPDLEENTNVDASIVDISASEDDDFVGPVPVDHEKSEAHLKLEKRALELKLAKLTEKERRTDDATREEWMLELPELRSVAGLGLTARQFRTKERDELKDRSGWTETPRDREEKSRKGPVTTENLAETVSQKAAKAHREKRDAEQEAMARKHKKKHKRDESLMELHEKKLKKKSQKEPEKVERRPFSRDTDLKVNRFDDAQKKAVIKKAQLLDSRFGSGESKYL